jgi:hypothetical protein
MRGIHRNPGMRRTPPGGSRRGSAGTLQPEQRFMLRVAPTGPVIHAMCGPDCGPGTNYGTMML